MDPRTGLTPFDGGALVRRLLGDFDPWFEDTDWPLFRRRVASNEFGWLPDVEVGEREGKMFVRVDLPGVKKEDVTVTAENEYLTIAGERKEETESKEGEWFRTERRYGKFTRVIPLPQGTSTSEIVATFDAGVLEVKVPLPSATVAAQPQRIPIGGATTDKQNKAAA